MMKKLVLFLGAFLVTGAVARAEVWINEINYDDVGTDSNEFVEVAGDAGTDLTGYYLLRYNGSTGAPYGSNDLTGTIDNEGSGFGAVVAGAFPANGLQNGAPDGVALVGPTGLIHFLSYEGTFSGVGGAADGILSVDVGIVDSTSVEGSIQLTGTGTSYADFTWSGLTEPDTPGDINAGQTFGAGPTNQPPVIQNIGNQTVSSGGTLNFDVIADDTTDNDDIGLWAMDLPAGATFGPVTNAASVTNTFDWVGAAPVGVYTTTFFAVDKDGQTTQTIEITVEAQSPPVLNAIGNKAADEGDNLVFEVTATPTDSDVVTLTVSNLPAGAMFYPTNEIGLFDWQNVSPTGEYSVTFNAADDDGAVDETITITISPPPAQSTNNVWINEFHYDNAGGDLNEGFEIAGPAGLDLTNYVVYSINGNGGAIYSSVILGGIIPDEGCGYGAIWFDAADAPQNGPDGFALVDPDGNYVQFLSYEGVITGAEGAVNGIVSEDAGVAESSATLDSESLQLSGDGTQYSDFTWGAAVASTHNALNAGQTIASCTPTNIAPSISDPGAQSLNVGQDLTFGVTASEGDGDAITLTATNLPAGATFDATNAVGSAAGTFTWNSASPAGSYTVYFDAVDKDGTASQSVTIDVIPPNTNQIWINEVGYNSVGTDTNEWIEIAGLAGLSLDDYEVALISGTGSEYLTFDLAEASFVFTDECGGYGFFVLGSVYPPIGTEDLRPSNWLANNNIQNGTADSVQIREKVGGFNLHLLDYDGDNATTTEDQVADVADLGGDNDSIYLTGGPGSGYAAFSWTNDTGMATPGMCNLAQSFGSDFPPNLVNPGAQAVIISNLLSFSVNATESDGDTVELSASGLPAGASFAGATGTAPLSDTFTWTPTDANTTGVYQVTFSAGDKDGTNSITVDITVSPIPPPLVARINEFDYDDGPDVNEFIELIGVAGSDMDGAFVVHVNGSDAGDDDIFRYDFVGTHLIPDDGITDTNGTALGFVVLAKTGHSLLNVDFEWGATAMQNGPDGLILYDSSSNILDAVAYDNAGDMEIDDPGTVSSAGQTCEDNFLAITLDDISNDTQSVSAPSDILGDDGSGWILEASTPGAINGSQVSGMINIDSCGGGAAPTNFVPAITVPGAQATQEGLGVNFSVEASELDGDEVTLYASGLPAGATFTTVTNLGGVTNSFDWANPTPTGVYTVLFIAEDKDGAVTGSVDITVNPVPPANTNNIWINEVAYDGTGSTNEWVELVGLAGLALDDYELVFVNGSNGDEYKTVDLAEAAFTFTAEDDGYGFFVVGDIVNGAAVPDLTPSNWNASGNNIQNGPQEGIQLRVKGGGAVLHTFAYEGDNTFIIEDQFTDLAEGGTDDDSLFLDGGCGTTFSHFSWTNTPASATPGAVNVGQDICPVVGGDLDMDGIADSWETTFCGGDCDPNASTGDGDNYTYIEEFILDFDPTANDDFYFNFVAGPIESREFTISGVKNTRDYVLEFTYSIEDEVDGSDNANWTFVEQFTPTTNGTYLLNQSAAGDNPFRAYRIRALAPTP